MKIWQHERLLTMADSGGAGTGCGNIRSDGQGQPVGLWQSFFVVIARGHEIRWWRSGSTLTIWSVFWLVFGSTLVVIWYCSHPHQVIQCQHKNTPPDPSLVSSPVLSFTPTPTNKHWMYNHITYTIRSLHWVHQVQFWCGTLARPLAASSSPHTLSLTSWICHCCLRGLFYPHHYLDLLCFHCEFISCSGDFTPFSLLCSVLMVPSSASNGVIGVVQKPFINSIRMRDIRRQGRSARQPKCQWD